MSELDPRRESFERAVEAVVDGDVETLARMLDLEPTLARARSTRAHASTLLNYVAANGVEDARQRSTSRAPEVARLLLERGAEVDALSNAYGGRDSTTLSLVLSSAPPARAGVQVAVVETLLDHGAAIEGPRGDGSPLVTALYFGHRDAARALARRGAKLADVVTAAALGREDLVRAYVDERGALRDGVPLLAAEWLALERTPKRNLELALVWSALHGERRIVELLLERGVAPGACDTRRYTAAHWAAHTARLDVLETLLAKGAPLEARNEFGGTVLGQALWSYREAQHAPSFEPVIRRLVAAGADREAAAGRLPSGDARIDELLGELLGDP